MILTPEHSDEKQTHLMKKGKCSDGKEKRYTACDCLRKNKIAVMLEGISKTNKIQGKK